MAAEGLSRLRGFRLTPRVGAPLRYGRVSRFDGAVAGVVGCPAAAVGARCAITTVDGRESSGEVIGFRGSETIVALTEGSARIGAGARVSVQGAVDSVAVGDDLLGRVWDADGVPLDGLPALRTHQEMPLHGVPVNPLTRGEVTERLDVGVRAVNALLSLGRGQRIGLIAGSGVGKSMLLAMLCAGTAADVVVIGLIGERAREVTAFVERGLGADARARTVVVAVTADRSPVLRLRGAHRAAAYAEYFRAQGKQVLLLLDSLTRVGHAQRELGLAVGEPPTVKGYPPSVMSLIPRLVERAGCDRLTGGSITAIYTLLADGDDLFDPVVDAARAILDGHIVLSRALAEQGIYPAIDVNASVSRVMQNVCSKPHLETARMLKRRYALYLENRDLMLMGGYQPGTDQELDTALRQHPAYLGLITQPFDEVCDWAASEAALRAALDDA